VSKFKVVIGSLKPFAMLNPLLLLLKPALGTLGIKPVFTMIGLKEHSHIITKSIISIGGNAMQSILVVGIDVAKEKLDVAVFNGKKFVTRVYANTKEGIEKLIKDVEERDAEEVHFVMEATGSYNTKVLYALSNKGYPVYVLNPIVSKRYSEEQLRRTTTDKEVSKLLASYGYSSILSFLSNIPSESYNTLLSFKFNPSNKDNLKLKLLIKTLESLLRTKTRILNQIEALNQYPEGYGEEAIESLKKVLEEIEKEIKNIQDEIDAIINNEEESKDLYNRLTTIPGIGKRNASAIIAYFGSFSTFESSKQVASYIGLTPSIRESGKSVKKEGYSISRIGNPYLRQILFMASLSASKHNHQCSILYNRLLKEGKDKKLILIAVAHKLLRQAFAVAKYRRSYDPNYGLGNIEKEDISTPQNTEIDGKICTNFSYDLPFLQDKPLRIADY